jgi:polyisoprenoid-binding protein YceI
MRKTYFNILAFTFLGLSTFAIDALPQQKANLVSGQSIITIKGTSSLHDWEEKIEKFSIEFLLKIQDKDVTGIDRVNFVCKSASIESESSLMTNKTRDALQAEKFPDITFKLVSVDNLTSLGGTFSGVLSGDISLAGVNKRINISFTGNNTGDRILIKGSKMLNMSDYKIKPPTAMLGTLKAGDQVTISFSLQFQLG